MSNNVEVIMTAKEAQLVRAWMNGKRSVDAYEASLRKIDATQQRNAKSAGDFDKKLQGVIASGLQVATGWMSVQTAIQVATHYLNLYTEANRKAAEVSEDAAKKQEMERKRFQVQAGIGPLAAKDAQAKLRAIAMDTATSNSDITDIATMLISSGADQKTATGGGTKAIAEFLKAQGLKPGEGGAQEFTDSITKFILGQGKELNEGNIETLVKQLQSAGVKSTKFKIPDLKHWAKEAGGLQEFGRLSQEDIVALAATTSGSLDAPEASGHMRELFGNLAVAGGKKDATEALKDLGLKPEDVNPVNVGWVNAIKNLDKGLQSIPEKDQAAKLYKITEKMQVGDFKKLSRSLDNLQGIKAGLNDTTEYDRDKKTMTTGRGALEQRLANKKENQDADRGNYAGTYRKAYKNSLEEAGASPFYVESKLQSYDIAIGRGATPEQAARSNASAYVGGAAINELFDDGKLHDKALGLTEKTLVEGAGGVGEATNIRGVPAGSTIEDATSRRDAYAKQVKAYQGQGKTDLAEQARLNMEVQNEILKTLQEINRKGQNVQVNMPGGAAPAKPVPAANIGRKPQ